MLSKTGLTHNGLPRWHDEYAGRSLKVNGSIMRGPDTSTRDHFGEQDGMWSHEFGSTFMKLDQQRGLIHLKEENKQKTYTFLAIKEWRYNLSTTRERAGINKELDRTHDFRESDFYIAVDDVQYPEWRVMFFPQKGDFNSQEGIRDTELQLKRWMHIFNNVIKR